MIISPRDNDLLNLKGTVVTNDNNNEISKTLTFLLADPVGRIGALIIGIIVTVLAYENFVIFQKDVQLISKDQLIRVKEERLKQLNDQISGLKVEIAYKPLKEKRILNELSEKSQDLEDRNKALSEITQSIKSDNKSEFKVSELAQKIKNLKEKNLDYKRKLLNYESNIIASDQNIEIGSSWEGFGGRVLFGVSDISVAGYANTYLSVDGATEKHKVWPGQQFQFQLSNQNYLLNVVSISYVGSRATISISKK